MIRSRPHVSSDALVGYVRLGDAITNNARRQHWFFSRDGTEGKHVSTAIEAHISRAQQGRLLCFICLRRKIFVLGGRSFVRVQHSAKLGFEQAWGG